MLLFSNLESPLHLYVCNKLWYGIESISKSFCKQPVEWWIYATPFNSYTRKFVCEKESASPVTNLTVRHCKNIYLIQRIQGKRQLLKNPECKKYIEYSEKFQGKLCVSG